MMSATEVELRRHLLGERWFDEVRGARLFIVPDPDGRRGTLVVHVPGPGHHPLAPHTSTVCMVHGPDGCEHTRVIDEGFAGGLLA